jgi:hypothetical protein
MKPKQKVLFLLVSLILPYVVFVFYFVIRLPQRALPAWFPYVAICYFAGSVFLFPFLRRKVLAGAPPLSPEEQSVQSVSAARAARRLGYIWLIGPIFYLFSGEAFNQPWWASLVGVSWGGFLSWASFYVARKIERKARQNTV